MYDLDIDDSLTAVEIYTIDLGSIPEVMLLYNNVMSDLVPPPTGLYTPGGLEPIFRTNESYITASQFSRGDYTPLRLIDILNKTIHEPVYRIDGNLICNLGDPTYYHIDWCKHPGFPVVLYKYIESYIQYVVRETMPYKKYTPFPAVGIFEEYFRPGLTTAELNDIYEITQQLMFDTVGMVTEWMGSVPASVKPMYNVYLHGCVLYVGKLGDYRIYMLERLKSNMGEEAFHDLLQKHGF